MATPNMFHSECPPDPDDADGFRAGGLRIPTALGGAELVVKVIEIEAGNHLCPYHYEYVEEWLVVVSGDVAVRTPEGTRTLNAGDIVRFPSGPDGAHQVSSPSGATEPSRVLMFSRDVDPSVCVYVDSDKLAVYTRDEADDVMVRRGEASSHLDYFDGESA